MSFNFKSAIFVNFDVCGIIQIENLLPTIFDIVKETPFINIDALLTKYF